MPLQNAAATLAGDSTVNASASAHLQEHAALVGASVFFVDPSKVTLISFFTATKPQSTTVVASRQAVQGYLPNRMSLGSRRGTPRTNTLGAVLNKG